MCTFTFIDLLKLIIVSTFFVLLVVLSAIIFPDFVYNHVKNEKVERFLENDIVKAIWVLLTVYIDVLLIIEFTNFIC